MTTLILMGNPNQYTFANSIIAANAKSFELFKQDLTDIYVIHSSKSQKDLNNNTAWREHLSANDLSAEDLFTERVVEISSTKESINRLVDYIETAFDKRKDAHPLMVDHTNGTSLQKNLLSIASYVLDLQHQYMIDVIQLNELTRDKGGFIGVFLTKDVLLDSYISVPDSTLLDNIAYLNISEMTRYKRIIETQTKRYSQIDKTASDERFFQRNLKQSVDLKLKGDQTRDNAIYRIATSSISSSIEELITLLANKHIYTKKVSSSDSSGFSHRLHSIQERVENEASADFDLEFFTKFNDFMLYLRNSSQSKGRLVTDIERFKADLAIKMAFPFIEFYTDIVHPILSANVSIEAPKKLRRLGSNDISDKEIVYYGLDGDNTGMVLEELFLSNSDENKFRKTSSSIARAISEISHFVRDEFGERAIVFEAGDDLFFKGNLKEESLKNFQRLYSDYTGGLTCSIGYGRSFQEVFLALKLAKTQPGKNTIIGIEFQ